MGNLGDSYYYCSAGKATWRAAERRALSIGGTLAVVESSEENTFISSRLIQREAYIGLTDRNREGYFGWVDGSDLDYSSWRPGEPNGSGDFVEMNERGYWFDVDGTEKLEFVVEIKGCDHVDQIGGPASGSNFRTGSTTITYRAADGCGGVDTCSFEVIITTDSGSAQVMADSRSDQKNASLIDAWNMELYPNPAVDILNLDLDKADLNQIDRVEIFQSNGERLTTFKPSRSVEAIDVSTYVGGLYLIRVTDIEGKAQVQKFTIR
jgi:hypothetical protein